MPTKPPLRFVNHERTILVEVWDTDKITAYVSTRPTSDHLWSPPSICHIENPYSLPGTGDNDK